VIVSEPDVRRALAASQEFELLVELGRDADLRDRRMRERYGEETFSVAVLRVRGGGELLHGKGVRVLETRREPESIRWIVDVNDERPVRNVTVAMNWHPAWQAYADGKPVETRTTRSRHITIGVPARTQELRLEFERRPREKAWDALSAATLLAVVVAWRRERRRRSLLPPSSPNRTETLP
jgi:hypothetical protein